MTQVRKAEREQGKRHRAAPWNKRLAFISAVLAPLTVYFGLSPAAAVGVTSRHVSGVVRPLQEVLSCNAYWSAQAANGQLAMSADLRSAASHAAIAARTNQSWRRASHAMNYLANIPDALLTSRQVRTANRSSAIISASCKAIGASAPTRGRAIASPNSLSSNTASAWTYFVGNTSLTAVQVAGLEGNLQYESGGGLNPAVVQGGCKLPPGPCGVGIAQWTDPGGRFSNLEALAQTEGVTWSTLPVQLQFVWQELTSNSGYGLATLKACTTTACATQVVEQKYERPANQSTNCSASPQPSYCARLADANQLLAAYGKSTTPTASKIIPNTAGKGYWLLSNQGGVYSYGGAPFYGSAAGQSYFAGQTAVGMVLDAAGTGYWILSANGGIYSYGGAPFYGSAAGQSYFAGQTAVGMVLDAAGTGYWILSANGGIYSYGGAPFYGSAAGQSYFAGQTAASLARTADGGGYYIMSTNGGVYAYGDAVYSGGGV
jgi:hypothetical protein